MIADSCVQQGCDWLKHVEPSEHTGIISLCSH